MKLRAQALMTTQRGIASASIAAVRGIAIVFLASSCGQSTSSAILTTPSAAPSSSPVAGPTPSPPAGGPVPAELLGDWFLGPAASAAFNGVTYGHSACPSPPTAANCSVRLTLTATTYSMAFTAGRDGFVFSSGNVVVNNNEIDFLNEANRTGFSDCDLPGGVGRYNWTVTGGVLHFSLISEPCSGTAALPDQSWSRTH